MSASCHTPLKTVNIVCTSESDEEARTLAEHIQDGGMLCTIWEPEDIVLELGILSLGISGKPNEKALLAGLSFVDEGLAILDTIAEPTFGKVLQTFRDGIPTPWVYHSGEDWVAYCGRRLSKTTLETLRELGVEGESIVDPMDDTLQEPAVLGQL